MTLAEFFETFLTKDGKASLSKYFATLKGYREISIKGHKVIKADEHKNNETGIQISKEYYEIHSIIPVSGVPFKSEARMIKKVTIECFANE